MNMEHRWNEMAGETGVPGENPPQRRFVHHKSHMRSPGALRGEKHLLVFVPDLLQSRCRHSGSGELRKMQFAQGIPNMETARPSVFGQYVPLTQTIPPVMVNSDASAAWLQVPPSQMPWGIPTANQPTIVRFTAEAATPAKLPVIQESGVCMAGSFAQSKRKLDAEEELLPPMKQHITEEKMAAHLSQLHISPDYTAHQAGMSQPQQQATPSSKESEQQQMKRLVVCEELRKLKQEPIIPNSLLAKLEKPNMALVLWQPPAGNIGNALRAAASRNGGDAEVEEAMEQQQRQTAQFNNNNTSVLDLNTISVLGYQQSSSDSMMDL